METIVTAYPKDTPITIDKGLEECDQYFEIGQDIPLEKLTTSRKQSKQKFNWIRLAEKNRVPTGVKYYNPRVTYDGINWWLTVTVDIEDSVRGSPAREGIGVDLGVKT